MYSSVIAVLSLSIFAFVTPSTTPNSASSAPHVLSKRTPWNLDQALKSDIKAALTIGLKDAISIAATVLHPTDGIDNKAKNDQYMTKYFGGNDDTMYKKVRNVFRNLVGTNSDGTGSEVLGTVTVYSDDWIIPPPGQGPGGGGDGNKRCCELVSNGLTLTAYTARRPRKSANWGMHFCRKWEARVAAGDSLSKLMADDCASLKDTTVMDTTLMNRQNYAFAILHEVFHIEEVTLSATGVKSADYAYGAWSVLEVAHGNITTNKTGVVRVVSPLENADNFAWFAMVSTLFPFSMLSPKTQVQSFKKNPCVGVATYTHTTDHNSIST
ncbi:hypothetical protein G7Y79_00017g043000 [Physcia stellaris]|nr:hypothetical protein G7Y79_00017g043000 [Physcia stellaris]